ncbi:EthD family reductase [Sphingomonas sabuli]|uniref:EthD family reductase n=1 Tax=Sphingomonas sabuli TaxID=2764186 RepID=A0A7G9L279_9SPHN|nr:EthD family reductase [Sphingomonas sabuli]QNM82728.1 EthD family reductase [Sphingomonas sabuli]
MYILTITFANSTGATFDFDYFRNDHLPKIGRAFGPYGLGYASVLRGEEGVDGKAPPYFATVILSFREESGARDALASGDGQALLDDMAAFTNTKPVLQFNTPVA